MSLAKADNTLAANAKDCTMQGRHNKVPPDVRTRNRRKRYLDLHPEYFGPQLELAGVLRPVQGRPNVWTDKRCQIRFCMTA